MNGRNPAFHVGTNVRVVSIANAEFFVLFFYVCVFLFKDGGVGCVCTRVPVVYIHIFVFSESLDNVETAEHAIKYRCTTVFQIMVSNSVESFRDNECFLTFLLFFYRVAN